MSSGERFCAWYSQALEKVPRTSGMCLVPLDGLPRFNNYSVVLKLLYNMRLVRKISIKAFQSYTLAKLVQKLHFNHIVYTFNTLFLQLF